MSNLKIKILTTVTLLFSTASLAASGYELCDVDQYKSCNDTSRPVFKNADNKACGVLLYKMKEDKKKCGYDHKWTDWKNGTPVDLFNGLLVDDYKTRWIWEGFSSRLQYNVRYQDPRNCRHRAFGVESYKICRTAANGVEYYRRARQAKCGVQSYKKCLDVPTTLLKSYLQGKRNLAGSIKLGYRLLSVAENLKQSTAEFNKTICQLSSILEHEEFVTIKIELEAELGSLAACSRGDVKGKMDYSDLFQLMTQKIDDLKESNIEELENLKDQYSKAKANDFDFEIDKLISEFNAIVK